MRHNTYKTRWVSIRNSSTSQWQLEVYEVNKECPTKNKILLKFIIH